MSATPDTPPAEGPPPPPAEGPALPPPAEGPALPSPAEGPALPPLDASTLVADRESSSPAGSADRPEIAVGAAFAGGLALALILKRLAR